MVRRVTLADVAKRAGTSITSASMALADNGRVALETRIRVRQAAHDLGYLSPSSRAAASRPSSRVVAVVLPHGVEHVFAHPTFSDLLQGVFAAANEVDLAVIVSTSRTEGDHRSAYARIIRGRLASGLIVAAAATSDTRPEQMQDAGFPAVLVGRSTSATALTSVGVDDVLGGRLAVEHLTQTHGARRVAHVTGALGHQSARDKQQGWLEGLAASGLEAPPDLVVDGDYEESSGRRAADLLAARVGELDGIFFANDQMAMAAISRFAEVGIDVPHDVRVVGYDDHPLAQRIRPTLSTVRADMVQVGAAALRELDRVISGNGAAGHLQFRPHFLARQSCGCSQPA